MEKQYGEFVTLGVFEDPAPIIYHLTEAPILPLFADRLNGTEKGSIFPFYIFRLLHNTIILPNVSDFNTWEHLLP